MRPLFFLLVLISGAVAETIPPHIGSVWVVPNQNAVRFEVIDINAPLNKLEVARVPEVSVSWPGGKISGQGLPAPAETGAVQEKNGRFGMLMAGDFSIAAPPAKFPRGAAAWLAVTVWDGQKGALAIEYPGGKALSFPLNGAQGWVTRTFALNGFAPMGSTTAIVLHGVKSSADAPVLLGAASLFSEKNLESGHLVELGSTSDRSVVTVLAQQLPWDPKLVRHFLLTGVDKTGVRAAPLAVDPGVRASPALFLYPAE